MKVKITHPCLVRMGVHARAGHVVEVSKDEAAALTAVGRCEPAGKDDKLTPEAKLIYSDREQVENADPEPENRDLKGK